MKSQNHHDNIKKKQDHRCFQGDNLSYVGGPCMLENSPWGRRRHFTSWSSKDRVVLGSMSNGKVAN